jgi:hypothetical protein
MSSYALLPNSRSDPDNVYYTANIINNNTSTGGTQDDPIATFNETRDVPILRDANDYTVSVLKVQVNGGGKDLPIMIPQIKPGYSDPIYGISSGTQASAFNIAGQALVYTVGSTYGLSVGDRVTVSGVTGTGFQQRFNQVGMTITALTPTTFTALSTSNSPTNANPISITEGRNAVVKAEPKIPLSGLMSATCNTAGGGVGASMTWRFVAPKGVTNTVYVAGDIVTISGITDTEIGSTTPNQKYLLFNQANVIVVAYSFSLNPGSTYSTISITGLSTGPSPGTGNDINNPPTDYNNIRFTTALLTPIVPSQTSINNTIYTLTLNAACYIGSAVKLVSSGPVSIQWIPELFDNGTPPPTTNQPTQQESDYYYLYSYNHWVVLVNLALQAAYARLRFYATAAKGSAYTMLNRCPTVEYDENAEKFSFYTDTLGTAWGLTQGPPTIANLGPSPGTGVFPTSVSQEFMYVGYNNNFDLLMTNFDTQYFGKDQVVWGTTVSGPTGDSVTVYIPENTLIVRNKTGTNVQTAIDPSTGLPFSPAQLSYVTTQDFESTSSLWSPVASIVLTTTLIPIRSEYVSAPVSLGSGNTNNGGGTIGTASFQTVLADFSDEIKGDRWRSLITFTPSAEFIPVSLTTSHQEVKGIDLKISWRNRLTNQLIPLILPNTGSVSVRLLFRRKQS